MQTTKTLLFVTNGPLGLAPLGVLPTEPANVQRGRAHLVDPQPLPRGQSAHVMAAATSCSDGETARAMLRAHLGEDIYASWFAAIEFDSFDGKIVRASVPVKFLKSWIEAHYADDLLQCCAVEFAGVESVDSSLWQPARDNFVA